MLYEVITFQNRMIHICRTFNKATGVEVSCEVLGGNARIPAGLDTALYRIVQAGLTNSFLHGKARKVRVLRITSYNVCYTKLLRFLGEAVERLRHLVGALLVGRLDVV